MSRTKTKTKVLSIGTLHLENKFYGRKDKTDKNDKRNGKTKDKR